MYRAVGNRHGGLLYQLQGASLMVVQASRLYRVAGLSNVPLGKEGLAGVAVNYRMENKNLMTAADVIELCNRLENAGITVWVEGGWGVDALLGEQTRPHPDLDILIQWKDHDRFRGLLEADGYREIKLEIARPENFVLGDPQGREIDVHVVEIDGEGNVVYRHADSSEVFPGELLRGVGNVGGREMRCVTPEWQVRWHTGYKLREVDFRDVPALCEKFGIEYPEEYAHLKIKS